MSKTIAQITEDCGLSRYAADALGIALQTDVSLNAIYAIKDEIIQSLYRRIEKLEEEKASLGGNLDDLLFCVEDFQLGDYSPLMDEVFDSRHALEQAGIARRRTPRKEG
jgi:hypothetical protein